MTKLNLYEMIFTYDNSYEVYKDYKYFYSLNKCKEYINCYGMDVVRCKKVPDDFYISDEIKTKAKADYIERNVTFLQ